MKIVAELLSVVWPFPGANVCSGMQEGTVAKRHIQLSLAADEESISNSAFEDEQSS